MAKTRTKRAGTKKKMAGQLNMTKRVTGGRVTYYMPGIVEMARNKRIGVTVIEHGKPRVRSVRMVHRADLFAKFGETHADAGDGKYVNNGAINPSGKQVRGAHLVNPYLSHDGSYHTIVAAFQSMIPSSQLRGMSSRVLKTIEDGIHLSWSGPGIVSPWFSADELWNIACNMNPDLVSQLRKVKSQRSKVKKHLSPRKKFDQNLDVMRRGRTVFNPALGETEHKGGRTPYSMPLEQCGMAIDMCHLTDGFDADGNEQGDYYYRLAIGRMTPWVLYRRHWNGLDATSPFAYHSAKVLKRAQQAQKRARSKAA